MEQKNMPSCHKTSGGNGKKHMLMMLACCLIPIGLAAILNSLGYSVFAGYMMLMLCPLLHLVMMKMCMKKPNQPKVEQRGDLTT